MFIEGNMKNYDINNSKMQKIAGGNDVNFNMKNNVDIPQFIPSISPLLFDLDSINGILYIYIYILNICIYR